VCAGERREEQHGRSRRPLTSLHSAPSAAASPSTSSGGHRDRRPREGANPEV